MAQHSPKEWVKVIQWVDPALHLATEDIADVDSEIDTLGFRYAMVIVNIGVNTLTTWDIQVEAAAATGGTFADVTGAVFSVVGATHDDERLVGIVDLQGGAANVNRFLQLNGVATGGTDCFLGVTCLLFNPHDSEQDMDYRTGGTDAPAFEV